MKLKRIPAGALTLPAFSFCGTDSLNGGLPPGVGSLQNGTAQWSCADGVKH
jgi:hypothetical protein